MTDESAANPSASIAPADSAPLAAKIVCPKCAAELRNVTVAAGQKISCLNCGAKFLPAATLEQPQAALAAGRPTATALPKSPGYWLLRLAAGLAVVLAAVSCLLVMSGPSNPWRLRQLAYTAILPVAALIVYSAFSALSRLDQLGVHSTWQAGILPHGLASRRESSLAYILPLGVAGGLLPLMILAFAPFDMLTLALSVGGGALLFMLGLALDDFRQFFVRQEELAEQILRYKKARHSGWDAGLPCSAIFLTPVTFSLSMLFLGEPGRHSDYIMGFIGLTLLAVCLPIFRLAARFDKAVHLWSRAAFEFDCYRPPVTGVRRILGWLPLLYLSLGGLWIMVYYSNRQYSEEFWIFISIGAAFSAMAVLLRRIARWCECHSYVCRSLNSALPGLAPLGLTPLLLIALTVALTALQLYLFAELVLGNLMFFNTTEQTLANVLALIGAHYPLTWLLTCGLQVIAASKLKPLSATSDDAA